ncbi:MAG TPA: FKBP-type peptidyl-prolyl cis-trans isomerase [Gemmatimonadaceae bacterium]|nr:FKBP-type peptidyl-prolyl cis-trans isomerase [Gemmatimonadaceae bacterium]
MTSVAGLAMLVGVGCASQGAPPRVASPAIIDSTNFAPALEIDLPRFTRLSSGMYYLETLRGTGVVAADGRKVAFRYAAFLADGTPVETQRAPIEAELGDGMIRGLRLGLSGMREGGQRRLVVPPSLAYGRSRYGNVPPNSVLVFDVELISVR